MIWRCYQFVCDGEGCRYSELIDGSGFVRAVEAARSRGWAVSRNRDKCYCPLCAPKYRNKGRIGHFKGYKLLR